MDDSCEEIKAKLDAAQGDYEKAEAEEWKCRAAYEKARDAGEDASDLLRELQRAELETREAEVIRNGWRRAYDDCV